MSPRCSEIILYLKNAGPPMQSIDYFRDFAELILEVYLSMQAESGMDVLNSYDLEWFALTSKYFTGEV